MGYATYSQLLTNTTGLSLSLKYPVNFYQSTVMDRLGYPKSFDKQITVMLQPTQDRDLYRFYEHSDMVNLVSLDEGLRKYWKAPITREHFFNAIIQANHRWSCNDEYVKIFMQQLNLNRRDWVKVGNYFVTDIDKELVYISYVAAKDYRRNVPGVANAPRVRVSFGKFIRSVYPDFSDVEVETYVNTMKKLYTENAYNVVEVTGEQIRYYYHSERYDKTKNLGDLANSCMRYARCQRYLDIYVKNPKQCALAIVKKESFDRIIGRALIWTDKDGKRYLDRVYGSGATQQLIYDYAKKNDIGIQTIRHAYINLDEVEFERYPYMDSLCYLYIDQKKASMNLDRTPGTGTVYTIRYTDGQYGRARF